MTHSKPIRRCLAALTAVAIVTTQLVWPAPAEASHLGSSTASAGSAPPPAVTAIQSFQPDLFTGRATTAIPIVVPPGRKGMQPGLALSYSSSARNGWVGNGWGLDVGYIERSTKNGVPKYDSSDPYTFMFGGVSSDLVQIPDGTYRAKDEGAFLRFENKGASGWEVRDKAGTRYLFGQTTASQIESAGQVFRWVLDKVIDPNGNTVTYIYTKDQNQLYPAQIDYTGHDPTSAAPTNHVIFLFEDRPDIETSFRSGFSITTAKRLKTIETKATVEGVLSLARRYQLAYTTSGRTGRSLLSSVTQVGSDGTTSLPPITFTYTQDAPRYLHCDNCVPSVSSGNHDWQLQYQVGNLFPKEDGGNDQRLWPSGSFDQGQKCWQEQQCQDVKSCHKVLFWTSCDHQTVCQTVTQCSAIPQASWSAPILDQPSGSQNGISWSTDASGNLSVNGPQDSHLLAMTWLYTDAAKTVSLSGVSTNGRADVFYVAPGGSTWSVASGNQVPLSPGWTVVAVTAYNETGGFSLSMSANLATQVAAMNHSQFSPMGIAGDFNGDGYTDLAHLEPAANHWHVALNSPSGFGQEQTWLSVTGSSATVPLVGDVDADGRADLILWDSASGVWQVAKSTGSSFSAPTTWHSGFGAGQTPFVGDFNGDGFLDVGAFSNGTWTIALSTGTGFGSATTWLSGFGDGATPLTGDFNGDGLTDVAYASSGTITVALSNGSQLVAQPSAWTTGFGAGQALTTADINGDGLTDTLYYDKSSGTIVAAFSTGAGFGQAQTLMSEHPFALRGTNDVLQVGDFLGNGLSGFGVFNATSGAAEIACALGTPPDLLEMTANGVGGTTTLTYHPSSFFTNTNLPFAMPIVTQVSASDGLGQTYTTNYSYSGGLYDAPTKEFRGFQNAALTDAIGTVTTTTFSQDLHTKGRPLHVEIRDSTGHLFTKTTNSYSCTEPYPGVHFAKLDQTDAFVHDGDDTFRQVRARFSYDQYGNVTQTNEDGDMAVTGDERTTTTTFVYNTTAWILNKPSLTQTLDAGGTVIAQRRFYYDGVTATTTPPTVGNLTNEEEWLNLPSEQWLATSLTYDQYGNVATVTDALTRTTTNTYDATGTYLIQITNALTHSRTLAYDPRFGAVTTSTDQNNQATTTEYDALGRATNVIGPTDTSSLPTISYAYDLSTNPAKTTVNTRIQSGQPETLTVYIFTDGLGRTIQTRSPAEDSTKQIVTGAVEFDSRGLVTKQWASYLDAASSSYVPVSLVTGHSSLATVSYTHDPLGRVLTSTDPDGSVTATTYNDGTVTITDTNGHKTSRTSDAYGRLSQVEEFTDTESYVTAYLYDALNNLTEVDDARGHRSLMSYDSLGRKLSMDDPDMGHWTYSYDAVDNLASQTDARGVVANFTYDAINRLTRKDYTLPSTLNLEPSTPVTYTYDDPTKSFSKGKLTQVADGSGSSSFEYDDLGRLIKESKTIDGTTYTIQRSYDLLGRLLTLTYPDGEVASYTYNAQGGIETVALESLVTGHSPLVTDVSYNAAGQVTKIVYGNGVVTDYSYNPQTLRLSSLVTRNSSLATLQDFSYAFDPVGNVTTITDRVHTATQTFQYDPLNRLKQATGSYGTSTYQYDAIGNMTSKESVAMTYGLADGSKPHAVTATSDGWTLQYDANGNVIKKSPTASNLEPTAQLLSYDAENRLTEVKTAQEETVTVTFQPGWNFFSLPVIPENASITSILPDFSATFEQVSRDDGVSWTHYVGNPKFDDFDHFDYGAGYQIFCKASSPVMVTLKGKLPTTQLSTSLGTGWHLLPSLSLESRSLSQQFGSIDYEQVQRYDTASGSLTTATEAKPGEAYFVKVRTTSTWTPPLPRDPTTRFVYDGDGGKVKQITSSGTTKFLGESAEIAPDGKTTKYVFAGGERLAAKDSTGALRFYHGDHLGSSNVVTDGTGAVVELAEYTPYGSLSVRTGSANVAHKFTGQRQDLNLGLILFPGRVYDPQLGRFLQADPFVQDPADPQMLNRYSYVRNNPLNLVDPSGYKSFWKKFFQVVAIVAAVVTVIAAVAAVAAAIPAVATSSFATSAVGETLLAAAPTIAAGSGAIAAGSAVASASISESSSPRGPPTGPAGGFEQVAYASEGNVGRGVASTTSENSVLQRFQNWFSGEGFRSDRELLAKRYRQDLEMIRALSLKANDWVNVRVGARPIEGIGAGHRYAAALNGNRFEMGPRGLGKPIVTSNTTDISTWDTSNTTQSAIAAGLARTTTVNVSASGFVTSMGLYEAYFGGQPYQWYSYNSNFAVNSVIYGAGGPEVKNLGYAPGFPDN